MSSCYSKSSSSTTIHHFSFIHSFIPHSFITRAVGKARAQEILASSACFRMPDFVHACNREGTKAGTFRKRARRALIAAGCRLSELVARLHPAAMNVDLHP